MDSAVINSSIMEAMEGIIEIIGPRKMTRTTTHTISDGVDDDTDHM